MKTKITSLFALFLFFCSSWISAQDWESVGPNDFDQLSYGPTEYTDMAIANDGTLYVVFQDKVHDYKATVKKFDGTVWKNVGAPGFSSGIAFFTSIAIDGTGTPYVVYKDGFNGSATVQKFDGSNWEVLGVEGFTGEGVGLTAITLDNSGTPYVLYQDVANGYTAKVQKFDGTEWQLVGNGPASSYTDIMSIAIAPSGIPYVAFADSENLAKATVKLFNGVDWLEVGNGGMSTEYASNININIDDEGVPYVVYADGYFGGLATVKKFDGAEWQVVGQEGFSTAKVEYTSIAFDHVGAPYLGYTGYYTQVQKFDGTSWQVVGSIPVAPSSQRWTSLVIDNTGVPIIALGDNLGSFKTTVRKFDGTNWQMLGSSSIAQGGFSFSNSPSLALTNSGIPYVAYLDESNGTNASVKKFNGTSWQNVGSGAVSSEYAWTVSLAMDGQDVPYVAYYEGGATVKKFDGSNWQLVGPPGFATGFPALAVSDSGIPYVLYADGNESKATVRRFDGNDWQLVGDAEFSGGQIIKPTIKLDEQGTPYVAYLSNGSIEVKKYNGSTWVNLGSVGIDFGYMIDLVIDHNGTPYIAYNGATNGNSATVKKFNGSEWQLVGTAGFAQVQNSIAISMDQSGIPYVIYDGGSSRKLSVQKFEGTNWQLVGTEDFSAGEGFFSDIAIDRSGNIFAMYGSPEIFVKKFSAGIVLDTEKPVITCPLDISLNVDNLCEANSTIAQPTATDNFSATFSFEGSRDDGLLLSDPYPIGTTSITWTATDEAGNVSEPCDQLVNVSDIEVPTVVCKDITVQLDNEGKASIVATDVDGGSTDNCTIASITVDIENFYVNQVGPNPVILTVRDINGNINTCTATVTVEDNIAPTAVCNDITLQLDVNGNATLQGEDLDNGSSDAAGIASLEVSSSSFTCTDLGDNVVFLTVTDTNGNESSCSATVTVENTNLPVITCPADISLYSSNGNPLVIENLVAATAQDNCGGAITMVGVRSDGEALTDPFPVGNTSIQWTATDAQGNINDCIQEIVVNFTASSDKDIVAFSFTEEIAPASIDATAKTVGITVATGTNVTALAPSIGISPDAGINPASGIPQNFTAPVDYVVTAQDGTDQTWTITVSVAPDTEAPTITCPTDIQASTNSNTKSITLSQPIATDNISTALYYEGTRSDNLPLSDPYPLGVTTISWTAMDGAGNISEPCSQAITISGIVLPPPTTASWQPLGPDDDWPSPGTVDYTKLVVSPNGTSYVVYTDVVNSSKATVQRFNGTSWEVVGTAGFSAGGAIYNDIALGGDGTPYVVYSDGANSSKATVQRFNGTSWVVLGSAGFSAGSAYYTEIALSGDGTPYVVYRDVANSNKATVQRFNGTSWEVVGTTGFSVGEAWSVDISLAGDGKPYVVYTDGSNSQKATVQRFNGTVWEFVGSAGFSAGTAGNTDIALLGDGTPFVVYTDGANSYKATVQRFNGTVWEFVGSAGFSAGAAGNTDIALSGDGTPYVVYSDGANSNKATVRRFNGTSWEVVGTTGFSVGEAWSVDISLAGDGTPYVVYQDGSNSQKATVQRFNGTAWEVVGSAGFSAGQAGPIDIALAGDGTAYVVYSDNGNSGKATVQHFNGTSWELVGSAGFSAGTAVYTDIALSGDGTPYVVYEDYGNSIKMTVQHFNGTAWEVVGDVGFSVGVASHSKIAFSNDGVPYVVYSDNGNSNKATVQRFNGTAWEVVGSAGFSVGVAAYTKIVFSNDGAPYVVYKDYGNSNKATVQRFNGTSWEVVGNVGFSAGEADSVDIALSGDGTPYVVYMDGGNAFKATVQRFNGTTWEVVGSEGFSVGNAPYTSIALAGDGTPYVVYQDVPNISKATVQGFNGTAWEVLGSAGFTDGIAGSPSIAIDDQGNIIVVYSSGYAYAKTYKIDTADQVAPSISCLADIAQSAGSSCSTTIAIFEPTATDNISTVFTFEGVRSDSAALDAPFSIGNTTITWTAKDEAGNVSESCDQLVTVTGTGDCWVQVGPTGFSNGSVVEVSLALDGSGVPYLAFQDKDNEKKATVQRFNGSNWELVGPAGFSAGEANWTSLALDGFELPIVAYKDGANDNRATVQRYNGSNWELVGLAGFSAGGADYVSLALDNSGIPYVAYFDGANGNRATVQKFNGSEWELVGTAGFSADVAYDISLAIDGTGVPYVAYSDVFNGRKATVQRFNGSSWELMGPAGFSDGEAYWTSLAVDGSGVPYLAYQDVVNNNRATVQKFNGSAWEVVGPDGLSLYTSAVSLLLDASGVPYVAYHDSASGGKATVQSFNGSGWELVGNAGFSGGQVLFTDLAIDQAGNLYVAYASPNAFVKKFAAGALADQEAPTITCPSDIVQDAGTQCSIAITITNAIAIDNVSTVFTFEGIRSDGAELDALFPIGNTTITWTATDEAGNVSESCDQLVTVTGTGDCWVQQGLDINGEMAGDLSGRGVSLNADGTRLAIGARQNAGNGTNAGHVRIFEMVNGSWSQLGSDIDGSVPEERFGATLAMNATGNRVVIGASGMSGNGERSGGFRVYEYNGSEWIQLGSDVFGETAGDALSSFAISMNASGNRVAAGSIVNDGNGVDAGHVRIYELIGGNWSQLGLDIDGEAEADQSGRAVSLSEDGNRVAIGAYGNDGNGADSGHVRIFDFDGANWNQVGQDIDGEAAGDWMGQSVSLNSAGNLLAIGASTNDGNGESSGQVRIYELNGETWNQRGGDINGDAAGDQAGYSVKLSGSGLRVAIGALGSSSTVNQAGQARVFEYNLGSWVLLGNKIIGKKAGDQAGAEVSISKDGQRMAVGAIYNDGNGEDSGHVRLFEYTGPREDSQAPVITCPDPLNEIAAVGLCNAILVLDPPSATDNSSNSFTFSALRGDGLLMTDAFPLGATTVTWTATDLNGNISDSCDQIVTIIDKEIPTLTCPADISITITQGNTAVVPILKPTGTDICSGINGTTEVGTFVGLRQDGLEITAPYPVGNTKIDWTAFDEAGNASLSCTQNISVSLTAPQVLSVTSFVLVDADTDLDIMTITNGAIIHRGSLPTTNLNVRANTTSDVRSVRLVLAGALTNGRTESTAPYALYGDSNGNYAGQVFPLGNYRLTGTPYSAAALGGTLGTPLTLNFELSNNPSCTDFTTAVSLSPFANVQDTSQSFALTGGLPSGGTYSGIGVSGGIFNPSVGSGTYTITYTISNGAGCSKSTSQNITVISNNVLSVTSYVLVDADTDLDIMTITDGSIIHKPSLPTTNLNIRANTTSDVRSIRLSLTGALTNGRTESTAPYALYGDNNGNYTGQVFPLGNYRLTGTPYSATGLGGTLGTPKSVSFSLSDNLSCSDFTTAVSFSPLANVQDTSLPFALTGGLPAGGTYSGIGVSGGNFNPSVGAGTYIITYTISNGAGCSKSTSQNITVISNNVLSMTSFVLVNADTDLDIMTISNGSSIDISTFSTNNLNIRANTTTDVRSVRLVLSGALTNGRTESAAPYALYGDSNGDYAGRFFPIGNYSITGTPYSGTGLSGTLGTPLTVNFELISAPGILTAKQANDMTIYPNPATNATTASFNLPIKVKTIMVFDMVGRLVRSYKAEEVKNGEGYGLDLNYIQPGSYIIKTIDDQGNQYQKQMAIDY